MGTIRYPGHGAEIEEDIGRLRRHKLEFEHDVARGARRSEPGARGREARRGARAMSSLVARWWLQRSFLS